MKRITNQGLGDIMAVTPESEIRRKIGVEGSLIRPGRTYPSEFGQVRITGFSMSEKAYVGMDQHGVIRLYDEYGFCNELQNGQDNSERRDRDGNLLPRETRYDLNALA